MDGIVGVQGGHHHHQHQQQQQLQQQQQQQQQQRKEWRVVSSEGQQAREKLFEAEAAAAAGSTGGRMSLAQQARQRFPGPASSRQRSNRLYHSDSENSSAEKLQASGAKNGEEQIDHADQAMETGDTHIDDLQHQLSEISRQREQLQQMELELQVRFFARNDILRLQTSFDQQAKQHGEIVSGLQDQLHQREEQMQQMQQHSEERERQLQMESSEVRSQVWAKETLLREQTNELATLRRERDNAVAEQKAGATQLAEQLAEVESLKEQVHEKERRLQELEEQLREAQIWMARSQELEAFHVNAMHAEMRDRTEQITQMWANCQRQVSEVERYYQQVIQKLQQDMEANHFVRNKDMTLDGTMRGSKVIEPMNLQHKPPMMHMEGAMPMLIPPDVLSTGDHATGVPVLPTPVLPMTSVVPPSGSQFGPVQPGPAIQFHQQLQPVPPPVVVSQRPPMKHQQVTNHHLPVQVIQRQHRPAEAKPNLTGQDSTLKTEVDEANGEQNSSQMEKFFPQRQHPYIEQPKTEAEIPSKQHSGGFSSVFERSKATKTEQSPQQRLEMENRNGHQPDMKNRDLEQEKASFPRETLEALEHGNEVANSRDQETSPPVPQSSETNGGVSESQLLDKDSLLACLIRVIPAEPSARIRISTTLPNRLAKVLAPLHWHDYRKHFGRLDEFVDAHSQLFVVEGDYVHLREGAHAIVSASTAIAKAAAAAASTGSVQAPKIALTPVAQQQQRSRGGLSKAERTTKQSDANGRASYSAPPTKNVNFKADSKRLSGFKENGAAPTNGYGNGFVNFNGSSAASSGYFKTVHEQQRGQEMNPRPQTQEGRIVEAA